MKYLLLVFIIFSAEARTLKTKRFNPYKHLFLEKYLKSEQKPKFGEVLEGDKLVPKGVGKIFKAKVTIKDKKIGVIVRRCGWIELPKKKDLKKKIINGSRVKFLFKEYRSCKIGYWEPV
jgi:hypothetical protein